MNWELWVQTFWDVLQSDEDACLGLIRSSGGTGGSVALIEGEVDAADALAYSRTLAELGRTAEAKEILSEVLRASFVAARPLGAQRPLAPLTLGDQ